jgi:hypothetical protein
MADNAADALKPPEATAGPQPQDKKKQIILNDNLRKFLGEVLHNDLLADEREFGKVLDPPRTHGRPADIDKLVNFLMNSQHDDCYNRKTTRDTVTEWINKLRAVGLQENERLIHDPERGRTSATEVQPEYIKIWADLMQACDESKKQCLVAFCMGQHSRLGACSPILQLDQELIKGLLCSYVVPRMWFLAYGRM